MRNLLFWHLLVSSSVVFWPVVLLVYVILFFINPVSYYSGIHKDICLSLGRRHGLFHDGIDMALPFAMHILTYSIEKKTYSMCKI